MSVLPLIILSQPSTKGRAKNTEAAIRGPLRLGYDNAYSGREFAEGRWHKLGDRGVDRDEARISASRHARGSGLDHATDGFVASDPQNCGADDGVSVAVDDHFHEASRFALLDCTADPRHWPAADPDRVAFGPGFGLGQADSP